MIRKWRLEDLSLQAESVDVECKAAQGRDGRGELPASFWESYSAMANGDGGVIWLGIQEKPRGIFSVVGLADLERVRKALWDNLHNQKQISVNLLSEKQVQPLLVDGKTVLLIEVPRHRVRTNRYMSAAIRLAAPFFAAMKVTISPMTRPCAG